MSATPNATPGGVNWCHDHPRPRALEPELECGDLILTKKLNNNNDHLDIGWYANGKNATLVIPNQNYMKENIKTGDIILFMHNTREDAVHRVTGTGPDCFFTKGDNNLAGDGCIDYRYIIGKIVWHS